MPLESVKQLEDVKGLTPATADFVEGWLQR
jgi:hypothetical protein